MKILAFLLVALLACSPFVSVSAWRRGPSQTAAPALVGGCPCPQETYLRTSSSVTLAGQDYVEVDTDAGLPLTITLPASPAQLQRVRVWLTGQPGPPNGVATIDPNGQPTAFVPGLSSLVLDEPMEGLSLLFVRPQPTGGGYWRVSPF